MTSTEQLLNEFIEAWNAGRRPRVLDFLHRAPDAERDELAEQLTTWLELAPAPDHDDVTRAAIAAEPAVQAALRALEQDAGELPALLPVLRERRGLGVADLAARVVERLGLGGGDAPSRAADYLGRLEGGDLAPERLSHRLLDALAAALGVTAGTLSGAGPRARPAAAGGMLFRADTGGASFAADIDALSQAAFRPAPPPMDELDRLFLGGPDA